MNAPATASPPLFARAPSVLGADADALAPAWEIARLAGDLGTDERESVAWVAAVLLAQEARGSTRIPAFGETGKAFLRPIAQALFDSAEGDSRLDSVESVLVSSGLLGRPGEYKPLIRDGDFLCSHRLHATETRVASAIASRTGGSGRVDAAVVTGPTSACGGAFCALPGSMERPGRGEVAAEEGLTREQHIAVETALSHRLALVTGGPGTGKTRVIASVVKAFLRLGIPAQAIAVAAPTGKAANRLLLTLRSAWKEGEGPYRNGLVDLPTSFSHGPQGPVCIPCGFPAPCTSSWTRHTWASARSPRNHRGCFMTGPETPRPSTLHSLLAYGQRSGRYFHDESNPLAARAVIVDEASMIDLDLMDRLLRATEDSASLILVGDADQLPPVACGAVFRDLVRASRGDKGPAVARLTRNFRMRESGATRAGEKAAPPVLEAATSILRGTVDARAFEVKTPRFDGVELLALPAQEAFLDIWYSRFLEPALRSVVQAGQPRGAGGFPPDGLEAVEVLLDALDEARILCLVHHGPSGTAAINESLGRLHAGRFKGQAPSPTPFIPGTPLVVERNDRKNGLVNGDAGVVLAAHGPRGLIPMAVFRGPEGPAYHPLSEVRDVIAPGWAITVHKSQGSEYGHVALALPTADHPLLFRELLYTAVTRTRRSVTILGSPDLFNLGVSRPMTRFTGLAAALDTSLPGTAPVEQACRAGW